MMKFFNKSSNRRSIESRPSDSGIRLSDSGSRLDESGNSCNGSRNSLSSSSGSSSIYSQNSTLNDSSLIAVHIYNELGDGEKEMVKETDTCEDICLFMAHKLSLTPTMLTCFGLGLFDPALKKYYWLAPPQKPGSVFRDSFHSQENKLYFRMRFLPDQSKCVQLDEVDIECLKYLMWQVKSDYLHNSLSCFFDDSKTDEARGFGCMLILLALRMNAEKTKCEENVEAFMKGKSLDHFLPEGLRRRLLEKKVLKDSMFKKVRDLQEKRPAEQCTSLYLMKWCLQVILKQNTGYFTEAFVAYDLDMDDEEFESIDEEQQSQIVEKQELIVTVKMDQSFPRLTVSRKNAKNNNDHPINCFVENVAKLEVTQTELDSQTWWKLQLFRQDGHPKMLYFTDSREVYSFVTCVECYYRLFYDFYDSVCPEVEPSRIRELNKIRAHGPVRDEFVRKKLRKKNSKDLCILRTSIKKFGQYDLLYLPSSTDRLQKDTLPKIEKVEEGYIVAGSQDTPKDLKAVISELIKNTNLVPNTCMRIKPQAEGCDMLQRLLMSQDPRDLHEEDEERNERRKIENQPKVYRRADLEIQSKLGQGYFTEVYSGLLCGVDEVVVKQLRVQDIKDNDFRIVQEAFHEGIEKLMILCDPQYFVGYMGMSLVPNMSMVMRGTSYRSLRQFLQVQEEGLPMLSLHHLLDVTTQLVSALVYMEEKSCYHGNLHCDNMSVMNYDNRTLVVKITDPGLVSLYNKLPLQHPVNKERLPWIAPELHTDLTAVTAQSEVFAYSTTLWQMFSHGLSPVSHDVKLRNKPVNQIIEFFANGHMLSCPENLRAKNEDPPEISEVKRLVFDVMTSCWNKDPQERTNPKKILKDLHSNVQSYEETYHKYNIIPYFDPASSAASYPVASSSVGTRGQSSGFVNSEQPVLVPDLTCLKQVVDGTRPVASPPVVNWNQAVNRQSSRQNQWTMASDLTRPPNWEAGRAEGPHELSRGQAQTQMGTTIGAIGNLPPRPWAGLPDKPTSLHKIAESRLEIDRNAELGKGHYGAVYKGKLHPTQSMKDLNPNIGPETIVVKVLKPEMVDKYSEDFEKEAKVMQTLNHPNVVKFYGMSRQGEYLVMEFVENNSLYKYVYSERARKSITLNTFLKLATDIAAGMEYLESQRVIHCDLAARNILLTRDLHAKISDFGLSKILSQEKDYYRRSTEKTIPILWCAPEWIEYQRFTSKSDVWSYGVVLWEMFSYGKAPFISKSNSSIPKILESLRRGDRLENQSNCPKEIYDEMCICWTWDPVNRPTFTVLKMRFQQFLEKEENERKEKENKGKEREVKKRKDDRKDEMVVSQTVLIDKKDLSIDKLVVLGKGSYGTVYKGSYKGKNVAIKECTNTQQYSRFSREFHLLSRLQQKSVNIVQFIGLYEKDGTSTEKEHMYVMEFLEGGSLWNYLHTKKNEGNPVDIPRKIQFLIDIAKGMDYLFNASIVHCDLTAKNVLLSKDLTAKISDFGWAKQLESHENNIHYRRNSPEYQLLWAAPEVWEHEIYTKFSDIWSYGVVCFEVFSDAKNPSLDNKNGLQEFCNAVKQGVRLPRPVLCPEKIYERVMWNCWQLQYSDRILYSRIIEELTRYRRENTNA